SGIGEYWLDGSFDGRPLSCSVEQNVGVEVAVAGVAVGGDRQPQLLADLLEVLDRLGNARARHRDVLGDLVRPEAAQGIRKLAPDRPEVGALLFILRPHRLRRSIGFPATP